MRPHRVRLFEGVRAHPGRGDAARQRAWRGPRLPGLTGVVVGRPTAEDSIVLTPVGVPSISFAIKICERPDAGVAEDEKPELQMGLIIARECSYDRSPEI